jgi:hypothetical protein
MAEYIICTKTVILKVWEKYWLHLKVLIYVESHINMWLFFKFVHNFSLIFNQIFMKYYESCSFMM